MKRTTLMETGIMATLLCIAVLASTINIRPVASSDNLVGHWKLDEEGGETAYDNSGNGNHGTLTNGPIRTNGKINGALSFDGVDDYVQVPDSNSLDLTNALTIAMWFKPAITITPENPWYYSLLMKWHGIGDQWRTGYGIQIREGRTDFLRGYGSGECGGIGSTKHTWNADEWYHIAVTYDTSLSSGNGKIYTNGVLEAQDNETRPIAANTLSLYINNDPFELWHPQVKFFPGVIDDVRIYDRALNETEIKALLGHDIAVTSVTPCKTVVGQGYRANASVTVENQGGFAETLNATLYAQSQELINETGLVAYWKFDEGSGTTAYDNCGNRDGTLMNMNPETVWTDGKLGKALAFDGTDDYVDVSNSSDMNLADQHTASFWIRTSAAGRCMIVAKHISGYPNGWFFALNEPAAGPNRLAFFYGTDLWVVANKIVNDGTWHFITGVVDSADSLLLLYIDGELDNTREMAGVFTPNLVNVRFGSFDSGTGGSYYEGLLDEIKVYDRVLSADEVRAEYTRAPIAIQTRAVTLESGGSATLTLTWDTNVTGIPVPKGNYTIWAYAEPVPGETDTTDNSYANGIVTVTIPGDVDGDFDVDILDVTKITCRYCSRRGEPQYEEWPNSDIDNDGHIGILDVVIACTHYGQKDP